MFARHGHRVAGATVGLALLALGGTSPGNAVGGPVAMPGYSAFQWAVAGPQQAITDTVALPNGTVVVSTAKGGRYLTGLAPTIYQPWVAANDDYLHVISHHGDTPSAANRLGSTPLDAQSLFYAQGHLFGLLLDQLAHCASFMEIDAGTGATVGSPIGPSCNGPTPVAVDPSGGGRLVFDDGTLKEYDATSQTYTTLFSAYDAEALSGGFPNAIGFSPDGATVFVAAQGAGTSILVTGRTWIDAFDRLGSFLYRIPLPNAEADPSSRRVELGFPGATTSILAFGAGAPCFANSLVFDMTSGLYVLPSPSPTAKAALIAVAAGLPESVDSTGAVVTGSGNGVQCGGGLGAAAARWPAVPAVLGIIPPARRGDPEPATPRRGTRLL